MSRGYHLQTIASGLNLGWGLALSSAIFGLLHLANPARDPGERGWHIPRRSVVRICIRADGATVVLDRSAHRVELF